MAVIRYEKQYRHTHIAKKVVKRKKIYGKRSTIFHKILPAISMVLGLLLLGNVVVPMITYELFTAPALRAGNEVPADPLSSLSLTVNAREYLLPTARPTPRVLDELDYMDLSNWFPENTLPIISPQEAKTYLISIPSVNIVDAEVVVGGKNLDEHLIQYPGTASPGDYGAPVIFGHSVLRQFYNPKLNNPRRYFSIFSYIMTLKKGDEIIVKDDGVAYTYVVSNKSEVKPDDRFILEQQRSIRELKLVTCVPEGTYLRRGIVSATLKEIN